MGDKATAKRVMKDAGVATTPGTDILESVDAARAPRKKSAIPCCSKLRPAAAAKACASSSVRKI